MASSWKTRLLTFLVALALAACGETTDDEPTRTYDPGSAVCDDGPAAPAASVFSDFAPTGSAPNALEASGDHLWITESSDNTVSRYDMGVDKREPHFIDVGSEQNPWSAHAPASGDEVYVSNWLGDTLSVADADTGKLLDEIDDEDAFDNPQGIASTDAYVYVTNAAYRGPGDYDDGFVTVVERESGEVIGRIDTEHPNPSDVRTVEVDGEALLLVVNTGDIELDDAARIRGDGSLEIWRETDEPLEPERTSYELAERDERIGAPGSVTITPDERFLYLPSVTAPVVFKFDLQNKEWARATDDPIELYESGGDATHSAAMDERGILYVAAFNEDALYLLDTRCDEVLAGPLDVSNGGYSLEGPQDLHVRETDEGAEVYVIKSLANALGRVDFAF